MIEFERAAAAADLLVRHQANGTRIEALPPDIRPRDRAEGYAIQEQWMRHTGAPLFGWKIAATSEAGQRHINVKGPMAGRLLGERVRPDGTTIALAGNRMRVVELELAFRMGGARAPRGRQYSVDEVLAAVATVHPALEIPDSRYEDFVKVGEAQLIADNACAHLFILGSAAPPGWREVDLAAHAVAAEVAGRKHAGRGANVLGDPRVALAWLANELSRLGIALGANEVVTTGTCVVPIPVAPGDDVRASFGAFGEMSVRFT